MEYWIRLNGEQLGPLTLEEVRRMPLLPETPVWVEGMEDWGIACNIVALADLFITKPGAYGTPPPVPGVSQQPVHPFNSEETTPRCAPVCPQQQIDLSGCPNNYIGLSVGAIVVLTAVCGVFGLIGLVPLLNSGKVQTLYLTGRTDQAMDCSNKAKTWSIVCYIIAAVMFIGAMILMSFIGTEALLNAAGGNPSFLGI